MFAYMSHQSRLWLLPGSGAGCTSGEYDISSADATSRVVFVGGEDWQIQNMFSRKIAAPYGLQAVHKTISLHETVFLIFVVFWLER